MAQEELYQVTFLFQMFVNTRLYQYNNISSQCVYIFDNFLEPDYQQLILDKTLELTKKDYLDKSTNVKANVTEVNELLQHQEYVELKDKIASYLNTIITHQSFSFQY